MERLSAPDLLVIQQAAGLLGRTVDELLHPVSGPRERHRLEQNNAGPSATQLLYTPTEPELPLTPVPWRETVGAEELSFASDTRLEASQDPGLLAPEQNDGSRVILLNPHTAQYACNLDYMNYEMSSVYARDISSLDIFNYSDANDQDFVQITPPGTGSDADSESSADIAGKQYDATGTEYSFISPPSGPDKFDVKARARSPLSMRSYSVIASNPSRKPSSEYFSVRSLTSQKIRKKRARYQNAKRDETNLTRSINSCVRCKMQRNRVWMLPNHREYILSC